MDFVKRCVVKAGASPQHADIIAEILIEADCRGVHSHVRRGKVALVLLIDLGPQPLGDVLRRAHE